jgi:3-hydroxybutyrate dehydrogenase
MANALAAAGCRVVLHGIETLEQVEPMRAEFERTQGYRADYLQADLGDARAVERMMFETIERAGPIDVLINNAVVRHFAPIEAFPVDKWEQALSVNLSAAFHAPNPRCSA